MTIFAIFVCLKTASSVKPTGRLSTHMELLNDIYHEHNKIRRRSGLPEYIVSGPMEEMLNKVGYNSEWSRINGANGHSQFKNLASYVDTVSNIGEEETIPYVENFATITEATEPKGYSAAALVDYWMKESPRIVVGKYRYIACTVATVPGIKPPFFTRYSYICGFHGKYSDKCTSELTLKWDRGAPRNVIGSERPYGC